MKKIIILMVLLLWAVLVLGQGNPWTNYTSQKSVNCLVQEGNFLWIGTDGGLIKYNTVTEEKIYYNAANSGLPDNHVTALLIDAEGDKWVGTWSETNALCKFDGTTWTYIDESITGIAYLTVTDLELDHIGNLWIGTTNGLVRYNGTVWSVFILTLDSMRRVRDIEIDNDNCVWVRSHSWVIAKFDGLSWFYYVCPLVPMGVPIVAHAFDNEGTLWISLSSYDEIGRLASFDGENWALYEIDEVGFDFGTVGSIAVEEDNDIWFVSNTCITKYNGTVWTEITDPDVPAGISVTSIKYIDSQNRKWFGTDYNRALVSYDEAVWSPIAFINTELNHNSIYDIEFDLQGNLWFATEWGIARYDGTVWQDMLSSHTTDIDVDTQNRIWSHGLIQYLRMYDGEVWTEYTAANSQLPSNMITSMAADEQGNIWVSTSMGMARFDGNQWTLYPHGHNLERLCFDNAGNLWGCINENQTTYLEKFDGVNWTSIFVISPGFMQTIYALYPDNAGNLWVAGNRNPNTQEPLYVILKYDGTGWVDFSTDNTGVTISHINDMAQDSQNNYWFATSSGLIRFDGNVWMSYISQHPGLPTNDLYTVKCAADGKIWIGSSSGVIVYDYPSSDSEDSIIVPQQHIAIYPNPFVQHTIINYNLDKASSVQMDVYNIKGQKIKTVINKHQSKGEQITYWDSKDDNHNSVSSGIYLIKLRQNGKLISSKKITLVK